MQFVCYKQWNQLPDSADALFALCEQDSIFHSRIWFENLVAHALTDEQSMLLVCAQNDRKMLAILPLVVHTNGTLRALSNHYTTHFSILLDKEYEQAEIIACLAECLSKLNFQALHLDPIDQHDINLLKLKDQLELRGIIGHPYFRLHNWAHSVKEHSFDEYMAARPSKLRNTIKRKSRKLRREHDDAIVLYQDVNIEQGLKDYFTVYHASWKSSELFADFKPALVRSVARLGWLRLGVLYIDEQPAAAQIWFVVHAKASIFRLAYDEAWKAYSPGSILTQYIMRYVIDTDKVSEIDYLTGKERYKQDWMTEYRERSGWHFVKSNKPGKLFSQISLLVKRSIKAVPSYLRAIGFK